VSGEGWQWDGVNFSLWQWHDAGDSNQDSCVLLVEAQGEKLLLTGDLDARGERAWVRDWQAGQVDWLQSPHHGSRSSSSEALLSATA
ncbi:competence protein ComEC, partial [Pseudomonas frederiksbergensis]|nr:competence protein ComEC [Pseudomonas frederiksbergensis]